MLNAAYALIDWTCPSPSGYFSNLRDKCYLDTITKQLACSDVTLAMMGGILQNLQSLQVCYRTFGEYNADRV